MLPNIRIKVGQDRSQTHAGFIQTAKGSDFPPVSSSAKKNPQDPNTARSKMMQRGHRGSHRRGKQGAKPKSHDGHGVRSNSRVGKLLSEFGGKEDWCSITILRHKMAMVIQSVTRGFLVRKRWRVDPQAVVEQVHAELERERQAKQRREDAKKKMMSKLLTQQQKAKASNTLGKLFGGKGLGGKMGGKMGGKWGKLQKNVDLAAQAAESQMEGTMDGSDSDFSDLELDDVVAIKLRARTPPWQRIEQSQWAGQYNKLVQRVRRGNLDVVWNIEESEERLYEVTTRRLHRNPHATQSSGGHEGSQEGREFDPATMDLPPTLIKTLLEDKYASKWERLLKQDQENHLLTTGSPDAGLLKKEDLTSKAVRPGPDDAPSSANLFSLQPKLKPPITPPLTVEEETVVVAETNAASS
ncbi:hypothetical protein CEUSTIGMA_g6285.t1 [Chlamydomonas eustigma]|uniref:Uncharacterized protein n=1 Tax=Chlamydomonas eustigma TaxID=1157962 RepID=A0A250X6Z7_9CHLO|nr:hypothetical protein CEUSTIGMA_g6285.t1 [Chlamydomonas eustigma]|eukprot:GAX78847.1 hypothetical protein CEUSTIGMA_g6285.t1 [Chlamydomonas eustigma]